LFIDAKKLFTWNGENLMLRADARPFLMENSAFIMPCNLVVMAIGAGAHPLLAPAPAMGLS